MGEIRQSYVYILTNSHNTVFYIGVTSDLVKRIFEHKSKFVSGFTKKYNIDKLVYYEVSENIESAILREKQIKKWCREWKTGLIEKNNPNFEDLYPSIC